MNGQQGRFTDKARVRHCVCNLEVQLLLCMVSKPAPSALDCLEHFLLTYAIEGASDCHYALVVLLTSTYIPIT